MLRKVLFTLYILVVVCMGAATFVEKYRGTDYAHSAIYGSWWFVVLWALLAAAAVVYIVRRRMRRPSLVLLHGALLLILAGALATHVWGIRGMVHLRKGETVKVCQVGDVQDDSRQMDLPFALRLNRFNIEYHDGTGAESDYVTEFTIIDAGEQIPARVSMNKVCSHRGVRLYQASYDRDMDGSILAVNYDPYGIPITYTGYALLFLSLLWVLLDPHGTYRCILRSPVLKRGALLLIMTMCMAPALRATTVLPKSTADKFGRLYVLYDNRVCPLQTLAIDFTRKLYGSSSYNGYTPEQVMLGFVFAGEEWSAEPLLKMKNGELRNQLQLPRYCSVNTFFNRDMGGYILGPYIREYYDGQTDGFHKQAADMDDRLMMVMNLRRGSLLKVFPFTAHGTTVWYSPTESIPDSIVGTARRTYMQNVFSLIFSEVKAGRYDAVDAIVDKMIKYQQTNAGTSLPTATQIHAERIYNSVPFATILFMVNLCAGLLMMIMMSVGISRPAVTNDHRCRGCRLWRLPSWVFAGIGLLSFAALTVCLILRGIIAGRIPMANGYETMLVMAWFVMLAGLALCRRFHIALPFALLMSGFFLLVSHLSQMDPRISHVMPVLSSPLLGIHVSVIMMSFALLSLTFLCGVAAMAVWLTGRGGKPASETSITSLTLLSRLLLYPAVALLAAGVFIGAVWANVSWGTYWSWDAKEVWGLITLMVYAIPLHGASLPFLRHPMNYHIFLAAAFLTIVMTYFGVNYFLGGMHSYA